MGTADKILVIDDHPETRDSITIWFELAGYTVVVARDGAEGLAVLSKERPDLVIADIVMPRLNGIEMIRSVRRSLSTLSRVPILVLTGYCMEFANEAISAGADRALAKPIDPDVLIAHVRHLLDPPAPRPASAPQ